MSPILIVIFAIFAQGDCFLAARRPAGSITASNNRIIEGDDLTLNCTLTAYSTTRLRNSALYIIAVYKNTGRVVNSSYYTFLGNETLQLHVFRVQRQFGNTFKCYMNDSGLTGRSQDSWIASMVIDIGQPPKDVNLSIAASNDSMVVEWCSAENIDPVNSILSWAIVHANKTTEIYNGCPRWVESARDCGYCPELVNRYQCACVFDGAVFSRFQYYNIYVNMTNAYGSKTISREMFYTGPNSIAFNNNNSRATNDSIDVSWGPSDKYCVDNYRIDIQSKWGNATAVNGSSGFDKWTFTDLKPNTTYTITARCPTSETRLSDISQIRVRTKPIKRRRSITINGTCYRVTTC